MIHMIFLSLIKRKVGTPSIPLAGHVGGLLALGHGFAVQRL